MAKVTQQQKLIAVLLWRGAVLSQERSTPKAIALRDTKAAEPKYFFIGKAGALRYGRVKTESRPVSDQLRKRILDEYCLGEEAVRQLAGTR